MLTVTQKLKDRLDDTRHGGGPLGRVVPDVGQEFVSVVRVVGQENVSKLSPRRKRGRESSGHKTEPQR